MSLIVPRPAGGARVRRGARATPGASSRATLAAPGGHGSAASRWPAASAAVSAIRVGALAVSLHWRPRLIQTDRMPALAAAAMSWAGLSPTRSPTAPRAWPRPSRPARTPGSRAPAVSAASARGASRRRVEGPRPGAGGARAGKRRAGAPRRACWASRARACGSSEAPARGQARRRRRPLARGGRAPARSGTDGRTAFVRGGHRRRRRPPLRRRPASRRGAAAARARPHRDRAECPTAVPQIRSSLRGQRGCGAGGDRRARHEACAPSGRYGRISP